MISLLIVYLRDLRSDVTRKNGQTRELQATTNITSEVMSNNQP